MKPEVSHVWRCVSRLSIEDPSRAWFRIVKLGWTISRARPKSCWPKWVLNILLKRVLECSSRAKPAHVQILIAKARPTPTGSPYPRRKKKKRELATNSYDEFHKIFLVFITLLGSILQTMYKPFETHYPKAVAFVLTIVIYFSSLVAELVLRTNGRDHVIVTKLSLFSGVLAVIWPIVIIVPAIGWFALGIWVCVSGIVVYHFYDEIRDDFVKIVAEIIAKFRSVMNKLRNGSANESQDEQNVNANKSRDERNGNANESRDEPPPLPV